MTNKEAIEIVRGIRNSFQEDCFNEIEALDLAIKALEERPQGEWIDHSDNYGYVECPFCQNLTNCEGNVNELHYCWKCGAENCGADMRGGRE